MKTVFGLNWTQIMCPQLDLYHHFYKKKTLQESNKKVKGFKPPGWKATQPS